MNHLNQRTLCSHLIKSRFYYFVINSNEKERASPWYQRKPYGPFPPRHCPSSISKYAKENAKSSLNWEFWKTVVNFNKPMWICNLRRGLLPFVNSRYFNYIYTTLFVSMKDLFRVEILSNNLSFNIPVLRILVVT